MTFNRRHWPQRFEVDADHRKDRVDGRDTNSATRYRGENALFAAPERGSNGRIVDIDGAAAERWVQYLRQEQATRLSRASQALGRPLQAEMSFQHAFNGVVVSLTASEAQRLRAQPGVALVEAYAEQRLDTDVGPALIGAPGVWDGSAVPNGIDSRGEGIVVGMIDSGINFDSPSFAAVEPGNAGIRNNLGYALELQGKYDDAVRELERAVRDRPDMVDAVGNLANTYRDLGRWADADAQYVRALQSFRRPVRV